MAMYCGCATKGNRIKWLIFGIFVTLGVVFTISWISVYISIYVDLFNCIPEDDDEKYNEQQRDEQVEKCTKNIVPKFAAIYGLLFAWIFCYIACSIPLYIMCCCTNPPNKTDTPFNATAMTHVVTPPHAQHAQYAHNVQQGVPMPVVQHTVNSTSLGNKGKTEDGELKPLLQEPELD